MTAPSLDALRDIHLPPVPVLATVLPEWWLVAALALFAVTFAAAVWYGRRCVRRRTLRAALRELARVATTHAHDADATRLARGLSRLLRRYAMMRFPQARIEGLTGSAWLHFLDAHGGDGAFCDGVGAVLDTRPYQSCGALDEKALIALVRHWLRANPQ
jgi:hypothetical protein